MENNFLYALFWLLAGIALLVTLTTRYKVYPFFALVISAFVVGLANGLAFAQVMDAVKTGFGNILRSLGLVIVLGTTLGVILEKTGSTHAMASYLLKIVREKRATLAMNITGFMVGLPIFCDSGYIVLSGLNQSLARRTRISLAAMATSLATGLYSVHCLIPPHPGATAAAGLLGADVGKLMLTGVLVAIPASIVGYAWARFAGKKEPVILSEEETGPVAHSHQSPLRAFLPVIVPIVLIAAGSFLRVDGETGVFTRVMITLGDPAVALSVGILLALTAKGAREKGAMAHWLQDSAEKAGGILVIIGAGGAFGAVLQATEIGRHLSTSLPLERLGLLFPFLVTAILKTAQGSSTVAIMTAASIVQPLLPVLGFDNPDKIILCTLAMGAGSMTLSHANDAYFWVIGKFSGLGVRPMLRVYSVATLWMGLTSLLMVLLLSQLWMNR